MRNHLTRLLAVMVLALAFAPNAWGQLANYVFQTGVGSSGDLTGSTTIFQSSAFGGYIINNSSGPIPIGFTFNFAGTNYTTFSAGTNGCMTLGTTVTTSTGNSLTGSPTYPMIAPFWDALRMSGGVNGCVRPRMHYKTSGVSPNRVLTVEWLDIEMQAWWYVPAFGTWQARLYESGKIEFWYGRMSSCDNCNQFRGCLSTSATIGIARSSADYMSVSPYGGGGTMSRVSPNNSFNLNGTPINQGEMYSFIPCVVNLTGRIGPGNGGTSTMTTGDTFFNGFLVQVGNQATWKPFHQKMTDAACAGICTLTISGPASADYYFGTPGTLTRTVNLGSGATDTVDITFQPLTGGLRTATLTVNGPGTSRTFTLGARAPLVNYTGIIPEGGTAGMNTNDTLMRNNIVVRHTSQCFTPFSLFNVSASDQLIDYTLNDPTGQYTISADTTLGPSGTTMPRICFSPTGFGPQPAQLIVNCGGEIRTFTLLAISAAPGGDFLIGGVKIDGTTELFRNRYGCVGEEAVFYTVTMVNTGYNDFVINGVEFYAEDTTYGQGVPKYPLLRDNGGNLIPTYDYVVVASPPAAPLNPAQVSFPIIAPQGTSRTIYIAFIGRSVGKRFARAVIRTNGQSQSGLDTNGVLVEGIVSFDVYARGSGSALSDAVGAGLPSPLSFPETRVKETAELPLRLVNNGICPLRINLPAMEIVSGDIDEFEIVTKPSSNVDPVTNDLILPPGGSDAVIIRFRPLQIGSRRAGLRLLTNDSTIVVPGVTERGVYYADLFGQGQLDLYGESGDAGIALIDGGSSEHTRGIVRFKNTRLTPEKIIGLVIDGADAGDFTGAGFPTLPTMLSPGQQIALIVEFGPLGGVPGQRVGRVRMITERGDTVDAGITGTAATRTIEVTPSTLNFGTISSSKVSRQTVAIRNTGTMKLVVQQPDLSALPDFTTPGLARTELEPGQVELLEVTFAPQAPGTANGSFDIASNGTNGLQSVTVGATAVKTKRFEDPAGRITDINDGKGGQIVRSGLEGLSVSAVTGVSDATGMELHQSIPNPARDIVEIGYVLPTRGDVRLELYNSAGTLVKVIDAGTRNAGSTLVRVDISGLANGTYHYRLSMGGRTLDQTLTIVH